MNQKLFIQIAQHLSIKDINIIRSISPRLFKLLHPIVSKKNQIIRDSHPSVIDLRNYNPSFASSLSHLVVQSQSITAQEQYFANNNQPITFFRVVYRRGEQ